MRRIAPVLAALALLSALGLVACGNPSTTGASPVVGTWFVDADKMVEDFVAFRTAAGAAPTEEEKQKAREGVGVTMEMHADGTWKTTGTMMGATIDDAGTYTLAGEVLTLTFTRDHGKETPEGRTVVGTYKDDVITVKPDEKMPISVHMIRK